MPTIESDPIKTVLDIIENSGNTFHCQVIRYFQQEGWNTLISPYYTDNATDKAREIDLIVEKSFPVNDRWGNHRTDIVVRLFIECKYIPSETVFWFSSPEVDKIWEYLERTTNLRSNNTYSCTHHYLKNQLGVAKLFAGNSQKNLENEPFYKALNQTLNAFNYRNWKPLITNFGLENTPLVIEYPVIACNSFDKLYRVDIASAHNPADPQPIRDNFMLEVNYAYLNREKKPLNGYFLIDVFDFSEIEKFLALLIEDVQTVNAMWQVSHSY